MKKRLFVATMVSLPSEEISFIKREIISLGIEGKWVEENNLHFTYRFLGDVSVLFIPQIEREFKEKISLIEKRKVELKGIGVFPDVKTARVLWVGVEGDLTDIKSAVDELLEPFGFEKERRVFKPHVTLMRIKKLRHRTKFSYFLSKMREKKFLSMEVKQVSLIESVLTSKGPLYKPLKVVDLR
ncbi:RNA 2',3'-cyclic phosphodiesterase [Desulfurobacterium atlanticum]|uniref:RNA 2',3'-cyclic phosphodiesterase n=1 Tax=Desulfurobacterium atlanticum TaxID=240169 RepID=A0A239ABA1_9BACT|nr:RNA 2',3'-cyclic phosphodiesterase [Desulfurobacterium atlanticum]SNR92946.1 2'-5' RNA ligase [Desulfurobacterium atlanticum]